MESPNGAVWYLAGARDAKTPRAGAIELGSAVFDINSTEDGSG
jgi:hypothetical protein